MARTPLLSLIAASWLASCSAPPPTVVVRGEGLQRDHYVLPAEPPPRHPMSDQERRALEAEWPAPTTRDIPDGATIICTWDVSAPVCAPRWPCDARLPCTSPRDARSGRGRGRSTPPSAVLVRAVPSCSAPPALVLEVR